MKLILASFLLIFLVFISSFLQFTMAAPAVTGPPSTIAPTPTTPSYCDIKCGARCYKAGYKNRCLKYCGICCQECKCVPSGTYGNKSECPCYRDKKNSKGTSKCP